MNKYIFKRILQVIPLLLVISFIAFTLIYIAPFDAIDTITRPDMSPQAVELLRQRYGLDEPFFTQYLVWVRNVLRGDLGNSMVTQYSISAELLNRIPNSIRLILPAYIIALIMAVTSGLYAASHRGGWIDRLLDTIFSLGISTPTFWMGMIIIYFFGLELRWFPILGMHTIGQEETLVDYLQHLAMPCLTLVIALFPGTARYVRSAAVNQLDQEYIQVQQSLGASKREIFFNHISKNTLLPLVTRIAMDLPMLVTGSIVTETIFAWPGIGPYFIDATRRLDYPVIMAILLLSASLVIIGNLLADVLYTIVDPRIRKGG